MAAAGLRMGSPLAVWAEHLRNAPLRRGFAIGFLILFAFIGTFTYVNFVLAREPFAVSPMALGFVYFVFLPSIFTTPVAGRVASRFGTRPTFWARSGLREPACRCCSRPASWPCSRGWCWSARAPSSRKPRRPASSGEPPPPTAASASGIYLACYFFGGLVGTAVLGQVFDRFGWAACVAGVGAVLLAAAWLAAGSKMAPAGPSR